MQTALLASFSVLLSSLVALAATARPDAHAPADVAASVERGKYIVHSFGCMDCHTPVVMGPSGPMSDETRLLSGHPSDLALPPAPTLPPGPWVATVSASMTAWAGPWGTSFTANLTPDPETGLGKWSEQEFVDTMRSGRHLGRGRAILPPMPWQQIANMTDEDLRSIFAYLQSIPPIANRVPQPLPPAPSH